MTQVLDCEQGSEEWRRARTGSLGASQVHEAIARTKSGWGASRANLMASLIAERLTGEPTQGYMNAAMQHGVDTEPQARSAYEFFYDTEVRQVGLVLHPSIIGTHASPDGLVGDDGLVELKCPQTATHIETLLAGKIPAKYDTQMQWQMACTGRQWCDFVSFDPRLPGDLSLFCRRVLRDDNRIGELESDVLEFLADMGQKLKQLQALQSQEAA